MRSRSDFVPSYGTSSRIAEIQDIVLKDIIGTRTSRSPARPSYSVSDVSDAGPRTACGWGQSAAEIERISGVIHHLKRTGLPCAYAVLGDAILDLPEWRAREVIQTFKSRLVRDQKRAGLPQYWLCVLESTGGLHANLVFPATLTMQRRLLTSSAFGSYFDGDRAIQPVTDFDRLARVYLSKERPPNVRGGSSLGWRLKGSHKLGEAGGDRVRLSPALRSDALAACLIEPWQRTKAKVLMRPPLVPQRPVIVDGIGQSPQGECPSLLTQQKVVSIQLPLFDDLPKCRPPFWNGNEVREVRLQIGKTQEHLAIRLGLKRPHVANVERGHDHLSAQRRRLLSHIMETERLAA